MKNIEGEITSLRSDLSSLSNPVDTQKQDHLQLAARVDILEMANRAAANKVKTGESLETTTSSVVVRLQVMAVKEGEKEL